MIGCPSRLWMQSHLKLSILTEEKQIDLHRHLLLVSHFPLNKNNSKIRLGTMEDKTKSAYFEGPTPTRYQIR